MRILLLLLLLFTAPAFGKGMDTAEFRTLPVLAEGRIQPLDSFARAIMLRLSGREDDAMEWLAWALFEPEGGARWPVFLVTSAPLRASFGLEEKRDHLYTLTEIAPGLGRTAKDVGALLKQDPAKLSADEQALLTLHSNALTAKQILDTFSLITPLDVPPTIARRWPGARTFMDFQKAEPVILAELKTLVAGKGEKLSRYTETERELAAFSFQLMKLRRAGAVNQLVRVIPSGWDTNTPWLAPWEAVLSGGGSPRGALVLGVWQRLGEAYRAGNATSWQLAIVEAKALLAPTPRLKAEVFYNDVPLLDVAAGIYAFALVLGALKRREALLVLAAGLAVHAASLGLRVYILERPPVGTLYESGLFVAFIIAALSLIIKKPAAAGLSAALLLIAPVFADGPEGFGTLSAVLNTNFWLATHVLAITAGYGLCLLVSLQAHALLWKWRDDGFALLLKLSAAALLLVTTGTFLGGIWADQSWGRFWGWDPKENGALLIMLWLLWLQHGRVSGNIPARWYVTLSAFLSVVVAVSWLGVNLLGVGLHAYGFTTSAAAGLLTFALLELALIGALHAKA